MTMMIRGIAAWLLAMFLLASAAHAHGGVGKVDKRCVLRIGPDIMFFTGYATGTLTFEHTFPETAKFIGIVTVKNAHGQTYVSQFPFSVGKGFGNSIGIYVSMVGVLAAAVFLIWHLGGKKKLVPPKKPA
jgi:hypothetical protein